MKRWSTVVFTLLASATLAGSALAHWTSVKLDTAQSRIGFTASTLLFEVNGRFTNYELLLDGDPMNLNGAEVLLSIFAASVDTGNSKRDRQLVSADFLDVNEFPMITFVSENITQNGNQITVTGALALHGVAKKVAIPFTRVQNKSRSGVNTVTFKGKLSIDRNDYGVGTDSVAAKISLQDAVLIDLLLVAFF